MSEAISRQHPAVVLRSHYVHVRALLAIAMIAIVGLTVAVVVLATTRDHRITRATTPVSAPVSAGSTRYDGGPEEGTAGPGAYKSLPPRYDGGPEEGTSGIPANSP